MNAAVEWVIRYPWRAGIVATVALVLLLSRCGGGNGQPVVAPSPSPTGSPSATISSPEEAAPTEADSSPTADPAAVRVGLRFVRAWLSTSGSHAQWMAGMEPYATPALLKGFAIPKTREDVPPARVDGLPAVLVDGPALWLLRVDLDNGSAVQVEVSSDGDRTLVTGITPERE